MKPTSQFVISLALVALASNSVTAADDEARFQVNESGLQKKIVDNEPVQNNAGSMVSFQNPESRLHPGRGIATVEGGLPLPESEQLEKKINGVWLPDRASHEKNLLIPSGNVPGTIRGAGITLRQDLAPIGDSETLKEIIDEEVLMAVSAAENGQKSLTNEDMSGRFNSKFPTSIHTQGSFVPDADSLDNTIVIPANQDSSSSVFSSSLTGGNDDLQLVEDGEQAQIIEIATTEKDTVRETPDFTNVQGQDIGDLGSATQPPTSNVTSNSIDSAGSGVTAGFAAFGAAIMATVLLV